MLFHRIFFKGVPAFMERIGSEEYEGCQSRWFSTILRKRGFPEKSLIFFVTDQNHHGVGRNLHCEQAGHPLFFFGHHFHDFGLDVV